MKISKMNSMTFAEPVELDFSELAFFVLNYDWSPSIYENNYRTKANFKSTDLIVFDVDDGPTFDEAVSLFADYKHIIATTKSHQVEKNGIVCDRYRVVLFLENPITDSDTFTATWESLYKKFPFVDKACKDSSRFFYKCIGKFEIHSKGNLIKPIAAEPKQYDNKIRNLKGYYPPSYLYAKNWGIPTGGRNNAVFRIACELYRCGYSIEEVYDLIESITDLPDYEVQRTVQSAANAVLK